jgi:heme oxygenase
LTSQTLHSALRDHTAAQHERLDASIGAFETLDAYRGFLRASYRFRAAAETALADFVPWPPLALAPLMKADLAVLGETIPHAPPPPGFAASGPRRLGMSYVLEGSALGSRLLVQRARGLGLSAGNGAGHLAAQSSDRTRWPAFLHLLSDAPTPYHAEVLEGAALTFDLALALYLPETI